MGRALLLVVLGLALVACGEPPVDLTIPPREGDARIADQAGVLDAAAVEEALAAAEADGRDIVVLTYETPQAGCGEAYRAAREFVAAWEADVALVAVARPGDFTSQEENRQRCIGIQPHDPRGLPAGLREQIAEEIVPPYAGENDWTGAFTAAVEAVVAS